MKKGLLVVLLLIFTFVSMKAQLLADSVSKVGERALYELDVQLFKFGRNQELLSQSAIRPLVDELMARADRMMNEPHVSVTEKSKEAVALVKVNPHEYSSLSIYFWPDSVNKNRPWIRIDGRTNREWVNKFDNPRLGTFQYRVKILTYAWWITGNRAYATKAAEQLRVWFLHKKTYMYPQMEHAQFVPNHPEYGSGTCWGIIDANAFPILLGTIEMLQASGTLSKADVKGLKSWFGTFSKWLMTSSNGIKEAIQPNNHGVHYDVLLASSLLFAGDTIVAKRVLEEASKRIDHQVEPDGSMPKELARAGSFGYTCWNLVGFTRLASIAQTVNIDLWHYQSVDNRSIKRAFGFLIPYLEENKRWEWREKVDPGALFTLFCLASNVYPEYEPFLVNHLAKRLPSKEVQRKLFELTFSGF